MVGTTRSRVSFFMNRFRQFGFIEYNGRIQVHESLLNAVLLDRLPEHNSQSSRIFPKSKVSPDRSMAKPCALRRPNNAVPLIRTIAIKAGAYRGTFDFETVTASFQE